MMLRAAGHTVRSSHVGRFYFVSVITFHREFSFAKRYNFGCNFCFAPSHLNPNGTGRGGKQSYTQNCTVWRLFACCGRKQHRNCHIVYADIVAGAPKVLTQRS